jgi:hypothetical protein
VGEKETEVVTLTYSIDVDTIHHNVVYVLSTLLWICQRCYGFVNVVLDAISAFPINQSH